MLPANRIVAMAVLIAACWYGMLVAHEFGHVLAAWVTGGTVQRIVLLPWAFSRTDIDPNPHPAVVAWAGPIFGGLFPPFLQILLQVLLPDATQRHLRRWTFVAGFFAGFCLIANGAYLATAIVMPVGDAEDLLRLAVPAWIMTAVGIPMFGAGLWRWHTLGKWGSHAAHPNPSSPPGRRDRIDRDGPGGTQ